MAYRETTEIKINEHGDETHESWVLIRASKPTGFVRLFDSELNHQHFVEVTISRCTRKRDLSVELAPGLRHELRHAALGARR